MINSRQIALHVSQPRQALRGRGQRGPLPRWLPVRTKTNERVRTQTGGTGFSRNERIFSSEHEVFRDFHQDCRVVRNNGYHVGALGVEARGLMGSLVLIRFRIDAVSAEL